MMMPATMLSVMVTQTEGMPKALMERRLWMCTQSGSKITFPKILDLCWEYRFSDKKCEFTKKKQKLFLTKKGEVISLQSPMRQINLA